MDAENAAAAVDLESGGVAVIETWPFPADRNLKEKQPFIWLGTVPYVAVMLVGLVMFAVGFHLILMSVAYGETKQGQHQNQQPHYMTKGYAAGALLNGIGALVAILGGTAACLADGDGSCARDLQRFGQD